MFAIISKGACTFEFRYWAPEWVKSTSKVDVAANLVAAGSSRRPYVTRLCHQAANNKAADLLTNVTLEEADVLNVLWLLFKSPAAQDRFSVNPPGRRTSCGGVLSAYTYVFLKKQNFPFHRTKNVALLLNRWRNQERGFESTAAGEVRRREHLVSILVDMSTCTGSSSSTGACSFQCNHKTK